MVMGIQLVTGVVDSITNFPQSSSFLTCFLNRFIKKVKKSCLRVDLSYRSIEAFGVFGQTLSSILPVDSQLECRVWGSYSSQFMEGQTKLEMLFVGKFSKKSNF